MFSKAEFSFLFMTRLDNDFIKSGFVPSAGTLIYSSHPFLSANSLYSISSSTNVSECSETNAIGTRTIFFPQFGVFNNYIIS